MNSHIGSESVADINSWTLTRGLAAENSPYYETGVKLSYISPSGKWFSSVMLLNGWQHIQQPKGIQQPSFGMQFYYQASERLLINYSNFIGSDKPDSFHVLRHFHDIYIIYQPSQDFGLSLGYDIGIEKTSKQKSQIWYSPIVVARYCIAKKLRLSARTEYFQDANQTLISTNTDYGFKVLSLSTNLDYSVTNQMIMKLESRSFHSKDLIFYNHQKQNKEFTIGLAIKW